MSAKRDNLLDPGATLPSRNESLLFESVEDRKVARAVVELLSGQGSGAEIADFNTLVSQLEKKGFGSQLDSWMKGREILHVTPEQLRRVLGKKVLEILRRQSGLPEDEVVNCLTRVLPKVIGEVTPLGPKKSTPRTVNYHLDALRKRLY